MSQTINGLDENATPANGDKLPMASQSQEKDVGVTRENFLKGTPLPADTVDEQAIENGSVTTNKLGDGAVTPDKLASGLVAQVVSVGTSNLSTGAGTISLNDNVPQNTDGDEYMTLAITPSSATNILVIEAVVQVSNSNDARHMIAALFQDSNANALAANTAHAVTAGHGVNLKIAHTMVAGTTSETTFRIRAGGNSGGTTTFNGRLGSRLFGATTKSSITITEYKA